MNNEAKFERIRTVDGRSVPPGAHSHTMRRELVGQAYTDGQALRKQFNVLFQQKIVRVV